MYLASYMVFEADYKTVNELLGQPKLEHANPVPLKWTNKLTEQTEGKEYNSFLTEFERRSNDQLASFQDVENRKRCLEWPSKCYPRV